jgi:hypothetical protein
MDDQLHLFIALVSRLKAIFAGSLYQLASIVYYR